MRIDHVVLGSRDLEETASRYLREHGLPSVEGGRHPAWGTANRIVPLGETYVEFLAVVDREAAAASRFGRFLAELTSEGDRWFTVCMADHDLDATADRLGLSVVPGARRRPDGQEVRWRGAGLEDPARDPWLPFFIEWQVDAGGHPGRMNAGRQVPADGIDWVEMAGDGDRLRGWLGGDVVGIRAVPGDGDPGIRAVGLRAPGGEIVL